MMLLRRLGPLGAALTLAQVAMATREHWSELPEAQRARLVALLRTSGGRPSNLTDAERGELSGLVRDLRLGQLARRVAATAIRPAQGLGRRRW